jgi:hypothetical protein
MDTCQPFAAKRRAVVSPIPDEAPVMRMVFAVDILSSGESGEFIN